MNFADHDPALRPMLDRVLAPADRARIEPLLAEMGRVAATELDELARTADRNPPVLRQYSPAGDRIDEIDHHPAYDRMADIAFRRFGLAAMSHRPGVNGWPGTTPHVVKYALSYLFVQSEFGLACPLSMTDSAARVLRLFNPGRFAEVIDRLTTTDPARAATGAMFMTEIDGGTDLARTATEATDHGDHWTLRGRKWFASNVSADFVLTLAKVPGQGSGTRGLGMFLLPRLRPDGTRNAIRIDRLKDKLGTRSMASGEVTLDGALAWPVGDLTRGVPQMLEMVNVSRLSNAMRSAALMRRAVREAVEHTRARVVFGAALFDQPLMRATLLPLLIDAEAALALVLESATQLDRADRGDAAARTLVRVLTPLAKYVICKRARHVTAESMEIRGGNGYIEDWVNARLLRDAHLGSIWEGSSNVIALDVLRCLRKDNAHHHLAGVYGARAGALRDGGTAAAAEVVAERWLGLRDAGERLLAAPTGEQEAAAGRYAEDLARLVMATLLLEHAGTGHRELLVAHTYLRLLDDPRATPAAALAHLPALADGGPVPADAAASVLGGGLTRV
ncbi:acyl-CoA dehydrogenase family protein [Amycolatopsis thermophila]|uniref:Alkylation response protein AidB-like acyl-CoA dehydrogenase n=1 Tax=Amycolatopsis thermophila TaxID=206084 RepID=A0ABU0F1S5_9PSEU|nr:acyl-CoA dehydrogenase family protein [Amycolatopsis thermophila]MDQ0381294.1 alkylation response protein AidB-like acyl-CoA dehydrogenase [Amycolatopsis thermophila]